jgi:hypothetical protein
MKGETRVNRGRLASRRLSSADAVLEALSLWFIPVTAVVTGLLVFVLTSKGRERMLHDVLVQLIVALLVAALTGGIPCLM